MSEIENISIEELDAVVAKTNKRKFDDPKIDRIIWTYKEKMPAQRLADYINREFNKDFSASQIRHQYGRLEEEQKKKEKQ